MNQPARIFLPALMGCLLMVSGCAHKETTGGTPAVVVYLFQGQNEGIPDELGHDPQLRGNLVKLFGYTHYRKLGEARGSLTSTQEIDLKPSTLFSIRLAPCTKKADRLSFALLRDDKLVLRGRYIPKPGVPLIIRGPHYQSGNLILILNTYK
ncbi:MAG: hypothetical protein PHD76_06620 [Methylacidiphilales bacterium]|nr:hypothetical protein [Candidatus Methylacidiphilales bacterium]